MEIKDSYSAASGFPIKLFYQKVIENGKIIPIHIQLIPTNKCNLNCKFCSCGDRNKDSELSIGDMSKLLGKCAERGTKAVTITGGGEPMLHQHINELIDYMEELDLEAGLVTNGMLLKRLMPHKNLTWCRISSSDNRTPKYQTIESALMVNPQTDWAFSHVVTAKPNYKTINKLIEFANDYGFTHVRLVSDLFDLKNVPSMKEVKKHIKVNDDLVIYQERKDSTQGTKKCLISLLKPVISPEGIFPCCGTQYAIKDSKRDMITKMKMGDMGVFNYLIDNQLNFDGSECDVCYYSEYNKALLKLLNKLSYKLKVLHKLNHEAFV